MIADKSVKYNKFYKENYDFDNIKFKKTNCNQNDITESCLILLQWKRLQTLKKILKKIEEQSKLIDVYLWNNNFKEKYKFEKILLKFKNSKINIYYYNSKLNIKNSAKVITANLLHKIYKNIIFFDDDQIMSDNMVIETFENEVIKFPNTILSVWAFDLTSKFTFWKRIRKFNNELVHYAGSGGAIYPSNLFSDLFLEWIPNNLVGNEDFLLNIYITTQLNGKNRASNANINFIPEEFISKESMTWNEKNQIHELKNKQLAWSIDNFCYPDYIKICTFQKIDVKNKFTIWKSNFSKSYKNLFVIFNKDKKWSSINDINNSLPPNIKKLFIRDITNNWYFKGINGLTTNYDENIYFLRNIIKESNCEKVTFIGEDSGGFASILYGTNLNVEKVLVFNPITFLDKETRLYYKDDRWNNNKLKEVQNNNVTNLNLKYINKSTTKVDIVYSNSPLQISHYENIKDNNNLNLTCHKVDITDDNIVKYLKYIGILSEFFKL